MSENRFDTVNNENENENENVSIPKNDVMAESGEIAVETPLKKGEIAKKRVLAILKALSYTLLFFGMQIVVSTAFAVFFSLASKGDEEKYLELYNYWSNFIVFLSGLLSVIAVLCIYVIKNGFARLEDREKFTDFVEIKPIKPLTAWIALFTGIFLNYAINIVLSLLPSSWLEDYAESSASMTAGPAIFYVLGGIIMAPIVEEIFFRGLVQNRLSRVMSPIVSIGLSSVIFGVGHGHPLWMVYAAALGAIFGVVYHKSGSILTTMLMHFGFNGINIIAYLLMNTKAYEFVMQLPNIMQGAEHSFARTDILIGATYYAFALIMTLLSIPCSVAGLLYLLLWSRKKKQN